MTLPRRPNLILPPRLRVRLSPVQGLVVEGVSTDKATVFFSSAQTIVTDALTARITCWGGGGPGGYADYYGDKSAWWIGGGGGGGCARTLVELSAGDTLTLDVGFGMNGYNRTSTVMRDGQMLCAGYGGSPADGGPGGVSGGYGGGGQGDQVWNGGRGSSGSYQGGSGDGGPAGNPGQYYTQTSNGAYASAGGGKGTAYGGGGYGYNGGQSNGGPGLVIIEWNYGT